MGGCGGWGGALLCQPGIRDFVVATPEVAMQFPYPPPPPGHHDEDAHLGTTWGAQLPAMPGVQLRQASVAIPWDSHYHLAQACNAASSDCMALPKRACIHVCCSPTPQQRTAGA